MSVECQQMTNQLTSEVLKSQVEILAGLPSEKSSFSPKVMFARKWQKQLEAEEEAKNKMKKEEGKGKKFKVTRETTKLNQKDVSVTKKRQNEAAADTVGKHTPLIYSKRSLIGLRMKLSKKPCFCGCKQ